MVDTRILGCCWIELPQEKWFKRVDGAVTSRSQIEVDVSWTDFIVHAPEGPWSSVAHFRILSFDIECAGRKGTLGKNITLLTYYQTVFANFRYFPRAKCRPGNSNRKCGQASRTRRKFGMCCIYAEYMRPHWPCRSKSCRFEN